MRSVVISTLNQEREHPHHLAVDDFTIPVSADMLTEMERTGYRMARAREDFDGKVIRVREALEQTKAHAIRFKAAKTRARRRDITVRDRVLDALRVYRRDQLELRIQLGMGRLPDDALLFTDLDGKPRSLYAVSPASGLLRGEDRDAGRDVPRPEAHPRLPTDRRGCGYRHDQQALVA